MSEVKKHFDEIAKDYDYYKEKNWYYYSCLKKLLATLIQPDKKVLEIGCGTGDLLVCLNPRSGVGVDISSGMIDIAKNKWRDKNLQFHTKNIGDIKGNFDYIFMSDVVEHLENPQLLFDNITKKMGKNTVFINTMANPVWEPILMFAEKLKLKMPEGKHFRMTTKDLKEILERSGMKIVKQDKTLLLPMYLPLVTDIVNNSLERHFKKLCFIEYLVAKKK